MEEEAIQLYRRPQMTGQARDEEDEEDADIFLYHHISTTCIIHYGLVNLSGW